MIFLNIILLIVLTPVLRQTLFYPAKLGTKQTTLYFNTKDKFGFYRYSND